MVPLGEDEYTLMYKFGRQRTDIAKHEYMVKAKMGKVSKLYKKPKVEKEVEKATDWLVLDNLKNPGI